jgi:perosamine synthetase
MRIPLSAPDIGDAEVQAVAAVLRTSVLSLGPRLLEFERLFAARAGTAHAIGVSSGTAALDLALQACGVAQDDEVITTPFSFIASTNAILYRRARPVFVDIDPLTLNIDAARVEQAVTARTRAILPVHVFGLPAPMAAITEVASHHTLAVVEDACEAIGADVDGRLVGGIGTCGVFGFYPNKQMTTGEGGMVVTGDSGCASLCRSLRNHGRGEETEPGTHDRLGYNYRLAELQCALGIVQLRRLNSMLAARERLAAFYERALCRDGDLLLPPAAVAGARRSWFVYVIQLHRRFGRDDRDSIVEALASRGIASGRYFSPIHLQRHVMQTCGCRRGDFPVTESVGDRSIALPFSSVMSEESAATVCAELLELVSLCRRRSTVYT